jgi:hypothetical protein
MKIVFITDIFIQTYNLQLKYKNNTAFLLLWFIINDM